MKNIPSVVDGIEFVINGEVRVTSKEIAKEFCKDHKNVMRAIRNLECSPEFTSLNFEPVVIIDKNAIGGGMNNSYFNITRSGWMFLVMGFTGKKAAAKKVQFIQAFNKMEAIIIAEIERQKEDQAARLESRPMTDALQNVRLEIGKTTKPFHYSNEYNMIYRVVLGATKKKWCEVHGIDKSDRFRDHMPAPMIKAIADMQRVNTDFIELGMSYDDRKAKLDKLYTKRHLRACLEEINKIES